MKRVKLSEETKNRIACMTSRQFEQLLSDVNLGLDTSAFTDKQTEHERTFMLEKQMTLSCIQEEQLLVVLNRRRPPTSSAPPPACSQLPYCNWRQESIERMVDFVQKLANHYGLS